MSKGKKRKKKPSARERARREAQRERDLGVEYKMVDGRRIKATPATVRGVHGYRLEEE